VQDSILSLSPGIGGIFNPLLYFKSLTDKEINTIADRLFKKRQKKEKDPAIRCIVCKNIITSDTDVISIAGQHRHSFRNPAGFSYEIGCFSSARGCVKLGEPTNEFTWFPGYSWCYSVCSKCYTHIGWYYQSADHHFYGLILNRLKKEF